MRHFKLIGLSALAVSFFSAAAVADINRVRVANETKSPVYIHVGGYAPASRIDPGQWKIYYYPFTTKPPEQKGKAIMTSLLVATVGGRWVTKNDYTYLSKPQMAICLDYQSKKYSNKKGNRVWTIKQAHGFDKNCAVKGYKQP